MGVNEFISSRRDRELTALHAELDSVLSEIKNLRTVEGLAELTERVSDLQQEIVSTEESGDDWSCPCGADVDHEDPSSGDVYIRRLVRHDGTDKVVIPGNHQASLQIKLCESCFDFWFELLTGHSVSETRKAVANRLEQVRGERARRS